MKIKRIIITILLSALFVMFWCVSNSSYSEMPKSIKEYTDVMAFMNNTAFGYTSIMAYCTIYLSPFILSLNNFFLSENSTSLVREKSRKQIYMKRIMKINIMSLIMCGIHTLINLILTVEFFNINYIVERKFVFYCILHMIGIVMFYDIVGIIFYIFDDLTKKFGISIFITSILFAGLFFYHKVSPSNFWSPIKDIIILGQLLDSTISINRVPIIYVRQILVIVLVGYIGYTLLEGRDYYGVKK